MNNANKPEPEELPSSAQLLRSTILAAVAAVIILVTIILPAEYGIDPTKIGRMLGLAEMGEIKSQLAEEAEADRLMKLETAPPNGEQSSLLQQVLALIVSSAQAQTMGDWQDEFEFTLTPGQGLEYKLVMKEGATAEFSWIVEGGVVNYDLHGDGSGQDISYEKGRAVPGHEGEIQAAFTGNHGWFWRNRGSNDVVVTVYLKGDYSEIKRPN